MILSWYVPVPDTVMVQMPAAGASTATKMPPESVLKLVPASLRATTEPSGRVMVMDSVTDEPESEK